MARLSFILMTTLLGVALAIPQRNLNYPTTKKPAPGGPAPTTPAPASTTPQAAPYPAAGFRPGRAFNLPTEEKKAAEPSPSYGPPADKYGPPEEPTTTVQPELDESTTDVSSDNTTAKIPKGLQPGFYFIQLPGGGIQKVALLTNAALVELPVAPAASAEDTKDTTTPAPERDVEGDDSSAETTSTVSPAATPVHVQPIAKTQRTVQVWPPVPVIEVKPAVVESARIVQPARSERVVAIEPVLFVQPKSYSYTSQFRSW